MSSSGSHHRLSRVLFRDTDPDFNDDDGCGYGSSELDMPPSESDYDHQLNSRQQQLTLTTYDEQHDINDEEDDEPSSPFKLNNLGPDMTSSPTYIKSVRELKLLNSSPSSSSRHAAAADPCSDPVCTPKTNNNNSSSNGTCNKSRRSALLHLRLPASTGAASSRTRLLISGRGAGTSRKRSYLTPLLANVNPFSPSTAAAVLTTSKGQAAAAAAGSGHGKGSMARTSSSTSYSSSSDHKRVRLSTSSCGGAGHANVSLDTGPTTTIAGQRLNFSTCSKQQQQQENNCSSDSGHVLLSCSTDGDMTHGSELSSDMMSLTDDKEAFDLGNWSSNCEEASDPVAAAAVPPAAATTANVTQGSGDCSGCGGCCTCSRFVDEFLELEQIGRGTFGTVFKCQHKLDGLVYAVKVSSSPIRGSAKEKRALNEVYAHAVLGKHRRVVHYYSSWVQEERLYIQNEFCAGGSLAAFLQDEACRSSEGHHVLLPESLVRRIALHVAQGLKYIHSQDLAHMDIKPENIFLTRPMDRQSLLVQDVDEDKESGAVAAAGSDDSATLLPDLENNYDGEEGGERVAHSEDPDDGYDEDDDDDEDEDDNAAAGDYCSSSRTANFKIGDLGLVTHASRAKQVLEGDCRYLARELLNEDIEKDLTKADVYALGMTLVEVMSGGHPLPKQDEEWRRLRDDPDRALMLDDRYSDELRGLVRAMVAVEPHDRPSAAAVVQRLADKSKAQLRRELDSSMARIQQLNRQLNLSSSSSCSCSQNHALDGRSCGGEHQILAPC